MGFFGDAELNISQKQSKNIRLPFATRKSLNLGLKATPDGLSLKPIYTWSANSIKMEDDVKASNCPYA